MHLNITLILSFCHHFQLGFNTHPTKYGTLQIVINCLASMHFMTLAKKKKPVTDRNTGIHIQGLHQEA